MKVKWKKWYAGFVGEKQVTSWYRSIDKAWAVARHARATTIRVQKFFEQRGVSQS
jgi:hypothetical protein